MSKMRFGIFMAPFHNHEHNPNAALHRDLGLIQHLDTLGFDEVWVGEHHSCGTEIIADPMIYCATALSAPGRSRSAPACCRSPTTTRCGRPTGSSSSTMSPGGGSCSGSAPAPCPPTPT